MTREEQIIKIGAQFAIDETDGQTSGRAASMRGVLLSAFRAGAHWADSYPNWISVEDELPPRAENSFIFSDYVLVCDNIGYMDTACYNFEKNRWDWLNNVTHWMPIVPPRKEEDDNE